MTPSSASDADGTDANPFDPPVRHLSQTDLSRRWRLSPRTLERWRSHGAGPQHLKIGGRVVYRLTDIEEYEAESIGRRERSKDLGAPPVRSQERPVR
jgi:hypothetical protein